MSSTVIDNRVVEMHFDNKDFEKNVKESMSTLDKLKNALNMDSAKALNNLGKATSGFTMDGISTAIEESKLKFSALQVAGVTAIGKITSAAMDMGTKLIKSLTIDQVTRGFDKYAEKTQAVQTIMSATGEKIEQITEQIDKLNWFTDETSYNLIDMTNNIAKFTSNGIKLEDATKQMMGIATAAALAGANSQDASHAMTGFSKAIGEGAMKRQNWQWIQTAHMDTMAFKQSLVDAAVEAGTLQKVGEGIYKTMANNEVSLSNFETAMKDGWITTKVMTGALEQYGNFSEKLHGSLEKLDNAMSTSDLLDYLEDYKNGTLDIKTVADELEISSEDLKSVMEDLSDESLALGEKSFRAAQEAKTFQEAIDAVKDAVSTAWMTTFEQIFGNYEEAKKLWTGVANGMWEVFAAGGEKRNQVLGIWKELGGRDSLLRGVFTLLNNILKPLNAVKAAFASLFPSSNKGLAGMLLKITEGFSNLMTKLTPSKEVLEDIYWIFNGIFTFGKLVISIFTGLLKAMLPVTKPVQTIAQTTIHILGLFGKYVSAISNVIMENGFLATGFELIGSVLSKLGNILTAVLKLLGGGFVAGIYLLVTGITKGVNGIKNFVKNSKVLQTVITALQNGLSKVVGFFSGFKKGADGVSTTVKKAQTYFSGFTKVVSEAGTITQESGKKMTGFQKILTTMSTAAKIAGTVIIGAFKTIQTALSKIVAFFAKIFNYSSDYMTKTTTTVTFGLDLIKGIFNNIKESIVDFLSKIGISTDDVKKKFGGISTILKDFFSRITVGKVLAIAFAVALLYVSSATLKLVDSWTQVGKSASGLLGTIRGTFGSVQKVLNTFDENLKKKTTFKEFAQSIALLSASLIALTYAVSKDKDAFVTAAITLGAMASAAFLLTWGLTKLSNSLSKNGLDNKFNSNARGMLILAGAIGILSVAMMTITKVDLSGETFKSIASKLLMLIGMIGILAGTAIVMSKLAPQLAKGGFLLISLALAMKVIVETMLEMTTEDFTGVKDHILDMAAVFAAFSIVTIAASKLNLRSAASLLMTSLALKLLLPAITDLMRSIADKAKEIGIKDKAIAVLDSINNWIQSMIDKYGTLKGNLVAFATIAGGVASVVALMIGAGAFLSGLAILADIFKGIGLGIVGMALGFKIAVSAIDDFNKATKDMSQESMKEFSDALLTFVGISGLIMGLVAVLNGIIGIAGTLAGVDKLKMLKTNFASVGIAFIGIGASIFMISQAVRVMATVASDTESFKVAQDAIVLIMGMLSLLIAASSLVKKAMPVIATFASILVGISVILAELAVLALFKPEELITPALTMVGIISALAAMVYATSKIDDAKKLKVLIPVVLMLAEIGATLILLSKYKHAWYDYLSMGAAISGSILSIAFLLKTISSGSGLGSAESTRKMQLLIPIVAILATIGSTLILLGKYQHAWYEYLSMGATLSACILSLGLLLKMISSIKVENVNGTITMLIGSTVALVGIAIALRMVAEQNVPNQWSALGALEVGLWSLIPLIIVITGISKILDKKSVLGTAFILVGMIGTVLAIAGALTMIGDIDADRLKASAIALGVIIGAITLMATLLGALQIALAAVVGALSGGSGGGAGAFALPALILSMGASVIMMASGLWIAAKAIGVMADSLGLLVEPIRQLSEVEIVSVAAGLTLLGLAMVPLSIGMGLASITCLSGAIALGLLGLALNAFGTSAQDAAPAIQGIIDLDMGELGKGMLVAAVGGLALIPASVGVSMFGAACQSLVSIGDQLKSAKNGITSFFTDVGSAMEQGSKTSTAAALKAGLKTALGYVLGFHEGAEWNSPPKFIKDFFSDIGYTMDDNWHLVSAATASGGKVGAGWANGFGATASQGVSTWLSKIGSAVSSAFPGVSKIGDAIKDVTNGTLPDFTENMFDIESILEPVNQSLEEMTSGLEGGAAGMEDFGEASGKAGSKVKDVKDIIESVRDSVANLDIFSKFEMKTEMSAQQMLDNMKSNLDGVASWTHKMAVLIQRGLDKGLYEKLAEMGPQSYEQVNAFMQMTDEQLQEANSMFQQSLTFDDAAAGVIGAGFTYAGEMATQGFSNALNDHNAAHAAAHGLGQAALDGINEALEVHSPSRATFKTGYNTTIGLKDGINDPGALAILKVNIRMVCRTALAEFRTNMESSLFYEIGKNATYGLANGIADSDAAKTVFERAAEIAKKAAETMRHALDEKSPSKVTEQIGKYASEGLAIGIRKGTTDVTNSAFGAGSAVKDGFQEAIDKINAFMDLNLNPVITPILDLSYMQQQMSALNSSFGVTPTGAAPIQNGSGSETSGGGITYVQNNYSPKELSRIDIYRQTRNQISMIGKVVNAHA